MSNQQLQILLTLKDKATAQLRKFQKFTKKSLDFMRKNWIVLGVAIAAIVLILKKIITTMVNAAKEVLKVNAKFEAWETTMRTFTESTVEAKKVLEELIDFSVRTPFTPGEVIQTGLMLKPLEQLGFRLNDLVLAAGNLKEAFGFQNLGEAAQNLSRALNAGVAAAELFRDKGVRLFLDLRENVDLTTLSLEKQREIILRTFTTGIIGDAIKRASLTFSGLMSTLEGELLIFKQLVGEKIFEKAKIGLQTILEVIKESKKEGGEYEKIIGKIADGFSVMFDKGIKAMGGLLIGLGQSVDVLNEMKVVIIDVKIGWLKFIDILLKAQNILAKFTIAGAIFVDVDANKAAIDEIQKDILTMTQEVTDARKDADIDWSENAKTVINSVVETMAEAHEQMLIEQEIFNKKFSEADRAKVDEDISAAQEKAKANEVIMKAQQKLADDLSKSVEKAFASTISGMIQGTTTAKEAFAALGKKMIQILVDFIAEQIVTVLLSKAIATVMSKFVIAQAAIIGAAWVGPAALASLATLGGNAKPAIAAIAATTVAAGLVAIPKLAEGGIVTKPTLALIGEAGPEAVIPLDKGFGSPINISFFDSTFGENDPSDIAEEIGFSVERALKSARGI